MDEQLTSVLKCQACLEYMDSGKSFVSRRVNCKKCMIRLIRNEYRDILLDITEKNKPVLRQELKDVAIHKKFVTEGKATIKFKSNNLIILISNAPCAQLISFLKHMAVKLINEKDCATLKPKPFSVKNHYLEDISPMTEKDCEKAKMKLKKKEITPESYLIRHKRPSGIENKPEMKSKRRCLLQVFQQTLSDEQTKILQAVKKGHNIFFTGSAGTGKSYVLKSVIASLPPDTTFATASTGIAACQISGTTLHQFAGIGKGDGSLQHCLSLASRSNVSSVWKKCQHLIIDEISMVDGSFFEKLEYISRKIRKNDKPFGGIQLIVSGDFFQLPPVGDHSNFCFQTKAWENCITEMFELEEIHRQSDPVLIDILQNIRVGKVTSTVAKRLQSTASQIIEKNGILATRLCTHSAESISINASKLEELSGDVKTYKAVDAPETLSNLIDRQSRVASVLTLKVGAQVMLLKNINISDGLVNGARGVVLKFDSDNLPIVQFSSRTHKIQREKFVTRSSNGIVMTRIQIPLTLAWAFSIHKSQGLTLDCLELSLSRVFEPGHAYVALSRVKSLKCLRVLDFNSKQVWADEKVLKFYKEFKQKMRKKQLL